MAEKKEVVDKKALQKIWIKSYLGQYYWARNKKRQLERRLQTFRQEMIGTKGMQYSPVPHSQTNSVGDGTGKHGHPGDGDRRTDRIAERTEWQMPC